MDAKNKYLAMQAALSVINFGGLGSADGNNNLPSKKHKRVKLTQKEVR
ncbi:hypothetical protein LRHMDP2_2355 [Lacticaseibacillus rhamnosus LRHMDP2]|uniref:Uncharacterized protein n=1 Tax=Lacticaseibacillus rhamnosus LRHMDP3 TaxID=1203259 RepID=A0AB33XTA5_LACRH|nr:hypothetical protein LRHMDP2_2355 [Lacticaseibacillus rhamnosus LRHMDP2]EKS50105.1 hypothetical protein LRHMDP3_1929 [Lacticaseibacillus rhamnosus LRHMDP3]